MVFFGSLLRVHGCTGKTDDCKSSAFEQREMALSSSRVLKKLEEPAPLYGVPLFWGIGYGFFNYLLAVLKALPRVQHWRCQVWPMVSASAKAFFTPAGSHDSRRLLCATR
ncbi:MAG: hypothetical protein ACI9NT_001606 [Bacteroidia bacterium]|jgi:hypothetical protein